MKKKIFALGLAACMAASLAACGGSKTAETTAGADTAAAGTEASAAEALDVCPGTGLCGNRTVYVPAE